MLERLFTSKTRVKILELLIFKQVELHIREISRRIGVSAPYVMKELRNLKKMNLLIESKKGNLKLYRINKNSPIYNELKKIYLKTEILSDFIKESLKKLLRIKYALIYGSFASGEEREISDIDLLVIGDIKEDKILEFTRYAEGKIGREINYILWNEKEFKKRCKEKNHLLINIEINPIIMLVGDENEFKRAIKR